MTTVIVPVPEAEALVADCRAQYDWSAARRVPAHITLLGPFLPPDQVDPELINQLQSIFNRCTPFRFALTDARRVGEVVYLAPEPVVPSSD